MDKNIIKVNRNMVKEIIIGVCSIISSFSLGYFVAFSLTSDKVDAFSITPLNFFIATMLVITFFGTVVGIWNTIKIIWEKYNPKK